MTELELRLRRRMPSSSPTRSACCSPAASSTRSARASATWSSWPVEPVGHGPRAGQHRLEFGIARFCLGIGESGNFPAAIKTVAEWFPQSERSLATGIFNSGANVGAILAPLIVPWVTQSTTAGMRPFWPPASSARSWILLWFFNYRKPTEHPAPHARPNCATSTRDQPRKAGPSTPWMQLLGYRQTWAFTARQISHRPHLVVLPVLAALLLQPEVSSQSLASGLAAHHRL